MKISLFRIIISLFILIAVREAKCTKTYVEKGAFLSKDVIYGYNFTKKAKSI